VSGDRNAGTIGSPRPFGDYVPFGINADALETNLRESHGAVSDAPGLLERGSGDFADAYQFIGKLIRDSIDEGKRLLHLRVEKQSPAMRVKGSGRRTGLS
jgi:argininosuccinate lyase